MKTKQEHITINGINYAICPLCSEAVKYPEGLYYRSGLEAHVICVRNKKLVSSELRIKSQLNRS